MIRHFVFSALLFLPIFAFGQSSGQMQIASNIFYGSDPTKPDHELQTLDVYWQDNLKKRPVILYLHGGGWAFGDKSDVNNKPDFFVPQGYAFISLNYRLRWDYKLFDQLEDVVSGIQWVKDNASTYGIDPSRIVLMGHEAGAHLASLVATDDRHLKSQNLTLKAIKAVVSVDSISYDIPRVHKELGSFVERRQHRLVFGEDQKVQRASSPIHHVKPGLPSFALLYVAESEESKLQAEAFAKTLIDSKVNAIMIPGNSKTKQSIDVDLGMPGDVSTGALMAFLRAST